MSVEVAKSDKRTPFFIVALIVMVIINIILVYIMLQDKEEIVQKDETISKQNDQLNTTSIKLDSISQQLDLRIAEAKRMDRDYQTLLELKDQILKDKESLKNASDSQIAEYREKIKAYESLLMRKDEELEQLKNINDELNTEIVKTKYDKVRLSDSISNINKEKQQLEATVAKAAILRAESLKIDAISEKGKISEGGEYKAKRVDKIRITFRLAENNAAKIETKQAYLRIAEPSGAILVGAEGGVFNDANGKSLSYTLSQQFLFDNTQQALSFTFKKGSEFREGKHNVEIYSEGHLIGRGSFTIR